MDKKKGLGLLLTLGSKDDEEDSSDLRKTAAQAILDAIKDDDVAALDEALGMHHDAVCEHESEDAAEVED